MKAVLLLEDGTSYEGTQFGGLSSESGEVVFNTGMVGYPEAMTDPSYAGQILVCTYPLIGNYGVPFLGNGEPERQEATFFQHFESNKIHIEGLVVANLSPEYSHRSAQGSLDAWMKAHGVPGLAGVDTRAITKRLRERGTMLGKLITRDHDVEWRDPNSQNIVEDVSVNRPQLFTAPGSRKCILVDLGAKNNIVRSLTSRGISVLKVPWNYDWTQEEADGIVISNGPGNPKMCGQTIEILRRSLQKDVPTLGICMGHQLMALAAGGDTYKMKYGHRSQNQPCIKVGSKRCYITSQNHGFAVDEKTLNGDWEPWFFNANDGTNEGIRHSSKPLWSVQFHPEATPGPSDTDFFFDNFATALTNAEATS